MWGQKVEMGQRLSEEHVDELLLSYQELELELSPVSAFSLYATAVPIILYKADLVRWLLR